MMPRQTISAALAILLGASAAWGQTRTVQQPKPATPPIAPRQTVSAPAQLRTSAPQVVTVVHRLNGLKMFRLLLRSEHGVEAIANLDEAFKLMDDVHTNVIAGLALEDGETIAARLPQADLEFPVPFPAPSAPAAPPPLPPFDLSANLLQSPDLTVIDSEGNKMAAQFVGVDGATGLSILKLSGKMPSPPPPPKDDNLIGVGGGVRLVGPEPAPRTQFGVSTFYVRIGEASGTIATVTLAPSGGVARLKARTSRMLSPENIGAIAITATGETIGIIDSVQGSEASILPASVIRRAATRVLTNQMSVPKPWLGVQGNPIASLEVKQIQKLGWELLRASNLALAHQGILLTGITPNSPAAVAQLKAGDVILKVNNEQIQSAEDFSWFLEQAGPSGNVKFTVLRPDRKAEQLVNVVLSASPRKRLPAPRAVLTPLPKNRWLATQGIETIAIRALVAARLGSTAGLLVVHVEPESPAFEAGLQPGDVIQSIDGRSALTPNGIMTLSTRRTAPVTFEIIRMKQKLVIALTKPAEKNN